MSAPYGREVLSRTDVAVAGAAVVGFGRDDGAGAGTHRCDVGVSSRCFPSPSERLLDFFSDNFLI